MKSPTSYGPSHPRTPQYPFLKRFLKIGENAPRIGTSELEESTFATSNCFGIPGGKDDRASDLGRKAYLRTGHFFSFHLVLGISCPGQIRGEITAASGENALRATSRGSSHVSRSPAGRTAKCRKGPTSSSFVSGARQQQRAPTRSPISELSRLCSGERRRSAGFSPDPWTRARGPPRAPTSEGRGPSGQQRPRSQIQPAGPKMAGATTGSA